MPHSYVSQTGRFLPHVENCSSLRPTLVISSNLRPLILTQIRQTNLLTCFVCFELSTSSILNTLTPEVSIKLDRQHRWTLIWELFRLLTWWLICGQLNKNMKPRRPFVGSPKVVANCQAQGVHGSGPSCKAKARCISRVHKQPVNIPFNCRKHS